MDNFKPDSIVSSIIDKFINRAQMGKNKYGTDLDRTDLEVLDWINHAQEEHMDAILYLEKLKQTIIEEKKNQGSQNN
jgi:hypothetical protein